LAVANRRRRADVKREAKAGRLTLQAIFDLADADDVIAQMRAVDLLESLPAVGAVKASRLMREAGVAATRRIRGLGPKQREDLLRLVG
jgi:hypothetical protein